MAAIIRRMAEVYNYINYEVADQRVSEWFLMSTPWPGIALIAFYLYFTFSLGPSIMARRPPMKLDRIMQIYDVIQIVLNAKLFIQAITMSTERGYSLFCEPVDYTPEATEVAALVHFYFKLKLLDLLDTVFFVLRKKDNQISFLHVYHHTGMIMCGWGGTKWIAGGHSYFLGVANSFVHVVMYTHYLVMSLKISKPWWKKYITQLQLLQFFLILVHFSQILFRDCGYPRWPAYLFIPQNLFMIVLFGDFYYHAYIKKKKPRTEKSTVDQNGKVSSISSDEKPKKQ
ncbi:hypothetical protein QAD02_010212 [Eretmocerus hayati]|uniref:Uncharacterized protein n=1 Tax=Eretmocerus hayati TaxID=131215 RepID=A0ACC2NBY3_9HYME|nr:hypothetical protein QAD02_010212 [Eretmocerus hayati]